MSATIIYRLEKGRPLTSAEVDENFRQLNAFVDSLSSLLGVALNPDGTLKDGSVHTETAITDRIISYAKLKDIVFGTVAGSANVYTASVSPAPAALASGQVFYLLVPTIVAPNTGGSTINIGALGVKTIKKFGGQALYANDIPAGGAIMLMYDGTDMQLLSTTSVGVPTPTADDNGKVLTVVNGVYQLTVAGFAKIFQDFDRSIPSPSSPAVISHTFTGAPDIVQVRLICVTANNGYLPGDLISAADPNRENGEDQIQLFTWKADASNIMVIQEANGSGSLHFNGADGTGLATFDPTQWKLNVRAIKF